ncbi:MAG: hypothetical protein Q8L90_04750 [Bacteroidota bacterium]|nr:hypothetical protein [Bacteroidota bacterium]
MEISIKGFIYHKSAEKYSDCFDRYGVNEKTNKFAISDGVSKSFFPDVWAELLVEFFLKNEGRINLTDIESYKSIQNEWIKRVGEIVNKPNQKYFVRNFFIQGRPAAATFVGLHFFKEDHTFKWEAVALGDSFLFFVPEQIKNINEDFSKVTHLSSKRNFEFNNFPDFFDSRNTTNKGKIKQIKNELKSGTFYLMTDALAEWFISEKQKALQVISGWKNQEDFESSIIEHRKIALYNDDSAILIIRIEEDNSPIINYKDISVTNLKKLLEVERDEIEREIPEKESIQKNFTEIEKPEKEEIKESQNEQKLDDSKDNITNDNGSNDDSGLGVKVEIIKLDELERKDEEISLHNKENNYGEIKNQKKGFWEKLVYPFWVYWNIATNDFDDESTPHDGEIVKIEENEKEIKQSELKEKIQTHVNGESENFKHVEKKEDTHSKKITSKNYKSKKNSEESAKPDEDISSITDKF